MKILIIEDAQVRIDFFLKKIQSAEIDAAKLADKGLKLLKENAYDVVLLDHDLIGAQTGSHITLKWQANPESFLTQNPIVIIHSMNIPGGKRMANHLKGIVEHIAIIPYRFFITGEVDINETIKQFSN